MAKSDLKKCFIITPIGDADSDIRVEINGVIDAVIKPILEEEYDITAAHLSTSSMQITKEIIQNIYDADLIIANLTGSNPNVMYELSLAHALRKPVIHVIRKGQTVPFDIMIHRYITYSNTMLGTVELREQLEDVVREVKNTKNKISNPIVDAIDTINVKAEEHDINIQEALINMSDKLEMVNTQLSSLHTDSFSSASEYMLQNRHMESNLFSKNLYNVENFLRLEDRTAYEAYQDDKLLNKLSYYLKINESDVKQILKILIEREKRNILHKKG